MKYLISLTKNQIEYVKQTILEFNLYLEDIDVESIEDLDEREEFMEYKDATVKMHKSILEEIEKHA